MHKLLLFVCMAVVLYGQLPNDLAADEVISPPGMINSTRIYSGYLATTSPKRRLHYVFVESQNNPANDPLVLWLNGGPGCSSLEGFLEELGPFYTGNKYTPGDQLTPNPYSWNRNANMLFLESPAGVGFSINEESGFQYDDKITADDAFAAIMDFLRGKGSRWNKNNFFITGESYAGKYIPDIAVRILDSNNNPSNLYINLQGLLIGNGVMNFQNDELDKSSIEYMVGHDFLSPHFQDIYNEACKRDWSSPRCGFFKSEYDEIRLKLNHYNVYEVCRHSPQVEALYRALGKISASDEEGTLKAIEECRSSLGMIFYLNDHKSEYHIETNKTWTTCSNIKYNIEITGSMEQYKRLLLNDRVKIWLYNGDADDVVPFPDTLKNLELLKVYPVGVWSSWFTDEYHAGFYQLYRRMTLITVKGAGHMVPQDKRKAAFQMFYNFIKNRPINTPVY